MVNIIDYIESSDDMTAGLTILIIMILQSPLLTFPGYILMIYAGFKFGLIIGSLINFVGLYTSCLIGYKFGKWSSLDPNKIQNPRLLRFHKLIENKGINVLSFLRIIPLIPNNFTSIGSGLTGIPEKQHALLSLFSIFQSIFWSFLGAFILKSTIANIDLDLTIVHFLLLLLVVGLLIYIRVKLHSN